MKKLFIITIICFLLNQPVVIAQTGFYPSPYIAPIDSPLVLNGNFAELRSNHFHSGIDLKTNSKVGKAVYATASGYVSRIKVSPTGFGKALYINHPNGTTSVYGHLKEFISPISDFVKKIQYERESFSLDTTIHEGLFQFKQGDIIAKSGNSGSSGGPHLHFEIRDTKSERPQNPLKYNFGIKDNMNPPISTIYLYPLSENSHVEGKKGKYRKNTVFYKGRYHLKKDKTVKVFGKVGIGIQAIDYLNGSWSRCGIYKCALIINNDTTFSFKLDNFSFSQTRYLNSHVDYEERIKNHKWVHKLYKLPGNNLDIYTKTINNGIYEFEHDSIYNVQIIVADVNENISRINFTLKGEEIDLPPETDNPCSGLFIYSRDNYFESDNLKLNFPKNTFYEDLKFVYGSEQSPKSFYSDIHNVHNHYTPIHKYYSLAIKTDSLPESLTDKALIVSINNNSNGVSSVGGRYKDGWVYTKLRNFGSFSVTVDTVAPIIKPLSISKHIILKEKNRIRFKITDDLSGIKYFRGEIDDKWVLFEYDPKSKMVVYYFDDKKIKTGVKHRIYFIVEDQKKNKAKYKATFFW